MICKRCDIEKDLSEFHKRIISKNGYHIYCKKCSCELQKIVYQKHKDKIKEQKKLYRATDFYTENSKKYEKEYSKIRKLRNVTFKRRFTSVLRDIIRRCLKYKGINKNDHTFNLLGYTTVELKQRIECQFKNGMSWNNYGEWHIDHKKPISKFLLTDKISLINSLSNLQPLWAKDNMLKGNKFND